MCSSDLLLASLVVPWAIQRPRMALAFLVWIGLLLLPASHVTSVEGTYDGRLIWSMLPALAMLLAEAAAAFRWSQFAGGLACALLAVFAAAAWPIAVSYRVGGAAVAALRLSSAGGRLPAASGTVGFDARDVLEALRGVAGSSEAVPHARRLRRTIAAVVDPRRGEPRRGIPRDSVEGSVAVLRSGWSAKSLRVLVDFGAPVHRLEVAVGSTMVMEGEWPWWASADGTALEPVSGWTTSCFESDDDATFLEIGRAHV